MQHDDGIHQQKYDHEQDYELPNMETRTGPQHLFEENTDRGAEIVRSIASFLTMSDAHSITSGFGLETPSVSERWVNGAGGTPYQWNSVVTPVTPREVGVSPNPQDESLVNQAQEFDGLENTSLRTEDDSFAGANHPREGLQKKCISRDKIASAVFSHPDSLRSYCLDAYSAAEKVQSTESILIDERYASLEDFEEMCDCSSLSRQSHKPDQTSGFLFFNMIMELVFDNIPLSVAMDILGNFREISLDTSFATLKITSLTIQGIVDAILKLAQCVWHDVTHFNPLQFTQALVSRPFNAVGKTTEVVVSGIQSVATGVGSASSMAFHRLSAKTGSSSNLAQQGTLFRNRLGSPKVNKKLIKKLSTMHSAASVVSYTELADDTGGLSKRMKNRVQRMMHYDVSLRPFVATIKLPPEENIVGASLTDRNTAAAPSRSLVRIGSLESQDEGESTTSSPLSPFMCTPQSFPPTPSSRRMVLARGTRFADDVIFLARDQLRVHDALDSENERTREMAMALTQGKRLAVFDADDASAGMDLTCGQHVATKVGSMLYCSTRSMVPILRNCYVYFEMTVLPKPSGNLIPQGSMATLSIGLSTKEMPANTLVGAWKGSVGLCSTGQILTAGQWCSPIDPSMNSYGDRNTVGCLVCLDDGSAFETWDGVMVTAAVTFNINERIASPPVSTLPISSKSSDATIALEGVETGSPANLVDMIPSSNVSSGSTSRGNTPPMHINQAPPTFTLPLLVPAEEELYPTVTLHSPGTAVMCRFSLGDIQASTRSGMGAPPGVAIYAIDGSVILSEVD